MAATQERVADVARARSHEWRGAGRVEGAWRRPRRSEVPIAVSSATAVAGVGLRDDCHADPLSPRQVLLASAKTYQRLALPPAALRESFKVSKALDCYPPGSLVALGPEVLLWMTFRCEPCARLNAHRLGLMRGIAGERGVLGRVIRGGRVHVGDPVQVLPDALPAWPDMWQERVRQVAAAVPAASVVGYAHLARLAGVPLAYCRVFPRVLAEAPSGQPHRAVRSSAAQSAPTWLGESLFTGPIDLGSCLPPGDGFEPSDGPPHHHPEN